MEQKTEETGLDFIVDNSELELIKEFLYFIRHRERGTFTANIVTHNNKRFVTLDFTDRKKIDLNVIQVNLS